MARQPSKKTLTQSMSHLRKQIERVKAMKIKAPPAKMPPVKVKSFGSTLIINGKRYGAKDLEKLKGTSASWQQPVLAALEEKLAQEEYKAYGMGMKPRKTTQISELEIEHAIEGLPPITSAEELEFSDWLNNGSPGVRKWYYYHNYGAKTINKGDVRGFLQFMEIESGIPMNEVSDLKKIEAFE